MLCFTSPTRKRFASSPSRLIASMILSWASLMSWYSSTKTWSNCRRQCCAAGVGPPVTQGCIKLLDFSLSSIGWRRGPGRGGAFSLVSPLLGPLPTRSSRGEDGELDAALGVGRLKLAAHDQFDQEVIGAVIEAHADSEVAFPLWREVQIDRRHDLLLLLAKSFEPVEASEVAVIFDSGRDLAGNVVADLGVGREFKAARGFRPS